MTYRAKTHKALVARIPGRPEDYIIWKARDMMTGALTWYATPI